MRKSGLSQAQWSILVSASASMFLWGIIASIGPLAASGSLMGELPAKLKTAILLLGPAALLVGDLSVGFMSDRYGRKKMFLWTMSSYGAGLLLIVVSTYVRSVLGLGVGLALAEYGIGGEEAPTLSLLTEDFSASSRALYLVLVTDFSNAGAAFISGLLLVVPSAGYSYYVLASGFALIALMLYARLRMPESFRWLKQRGEREEASRLRSELSISDEGEPIAHPGWLVPLLALALMGVSQYLTYGLMSFVIGPYEFPSTVFDEEIILFSNLGAAAGGVLAAYVINAGQRKRFAAYSFIAGFISTLLILLLSARLTDPLVFFPLLFFNMVMSEFAWAARITLEPEAFPTKVRGSAIGLIRVFPLVAYEISIYYTSYFGIYQFVAYNLVLWGVGVLGAVLWLLMGFETRGINPDYAVGGSEVAGGGAK
ncbi:MAG: MFS transporter [Candidatus Marsarchaeota archaeon]